MNNQNITTAQDPNEGNNKRYIHSTQLLHKILACINIVSFTSVLDKLKPSAAEFSLVTIKQLLTVARQQGWNLAYKNGQFYGYNGAAWWEYDKAAINWLLFSTAEKMGVPMRCLDTKFSEMMLEHFKTAAFIESSATTGTDVLVNFENGTYEITPSQRRFRGFDYKDNLHYQLPFSYDSTATAPMFMKFLGEVLPDKECQAVLAEFMGYVFTKTLKIEKVLLLYGSGANGKSVFFEIVNALLGRYNCSNYTLQSLTDSRGYERAKIANKLVNYCSEISTKMDTELFKILASGEPIEARLPYKEPFNMEGYAKLIYNCNTLPREVENNPAFFRRFLIIPFTQTIPADKQDKELAQKITAAELPGIFNWVMEGMDRLLMWKKFSECVISEEAVEKYKKESDSLQVFLDEFGYEKSDIAYVKQIELYDRYARYCNKVRLHPLSIVKFGQRIDVLGYTRKTMKFGKAVYVKQDPLKLQELLAMLGNGSKE